MLQLANLHERYRVGASTLQVLKGIDLEVDPASSCPR